MGGEGAARCVSAAAVDAGAAARRRFRPQPIVWGHTLCIIDTGVAVDPDSALSARRRRRRHASTHCVLLRRVAVRAVERRDVHDARTRACSHTRDRPRGGGQRAARRVGVQAHRFCRKERLRRCELAPRHSPRGSTQGAGQETTAIARVSRRPRSRMRANVTNSSPRGAARMAAAPNAPKSVRTSAKSAPQPPELFISQIHIISGRQKPT